MLDITLLLKFPFLHLLVLFPCRISLSSWKLLFNFLWLCIEHLLSCLSAFFTCAQINPFTLSIPSPLTTLTLSCSSVSFQRCLFMSTLYRKFTYHFVLLPESWDTRSMLFANLKSYSLFRRLSRWCYATLAHRIWTADALKSSGGMQSLSSTLSLPPPPFLSGIFLSHRKIIDTDLHWISWRMEVAEGCTAVLAVGLHSMMCSTESRVFSWSTKNK